MKMICRKYKRVITLYELGAYAGAHFATYMLSAGLANWLANSLKDYFLNLTRGFIDETMAGACNGLKMACPKCKKTSCWDPFPEAEKQQQVEGGSNENIAVIGKQEEQINYYKKEKVLP